MSQPGLITFRKFEETPTKVEKNVNKFKPKSQTVIPMNKNDYDDDVILGESLLSNKDFIVSTGYTARTKYLEQIWEDNSEVYEEISEK